MRKLFFTAAPMQDVLSQPGADTPYQAVNNPKLQYDEGCCLPILPLINAFVKRDDEIKVVIFAIENHNISQRYVKEVQNRVLALCGKAGANCEFQKIDLPFDDAVETHLNTFQTLIELIHEDDELYADITYLSRTLPIVETMALNFAYRTYPGCTVKCVAYGNKNFQTGEKYISDETPLFLMDQIVNELARSKNRHPVETIRTLLAASDPEEE